MPSKKKITLEEKMRRMKLELSGLILRSVEPKDPSKCSFCGGNAILNKREFPPDFYLRCEKCRIESIESKDYTIYCDKCTHGTAYYIQCEKCKNWTALQPSIDKAKEKWVLLNTKFYF